MLTSSRSEEAGHHDGQGGGCSAEDAKPAVSSPPSTVDRYFSVHHGKGYAYRLQSGVSPGESHEGAAPGEDTCVLRHHNGICVVCLSPDHPVVRGRIKVVEVKLLVAMRQVSGKRKRGGTFVEQNTRLIAIRGAGNEQYEVRGSVRGVLVEFNDQLSTEPNLVATHPLTRGYLAVLLPPASARAKAVDHLT